MNVVIGGTAVDKYLIVYVQQRVLSQNVKSYFLPKMPNQNNLIFVYVKIFHNFGNIGIVVSR